jgi:predicted enzyme related to lactoylglutathione lyase
MITFSISVDVPNLEAGVEFYAKAFGFVTAARPVPGVAVLQAGATSLCLLEKAEGTKPSPSTEDRRQYRRHWTPVHIDVHVDDLEAALARALEAGAIREQFFEDPEHGSAAFCSDPFGHGFCLLERRERT